MVKKRGVDTNKHIIKYVLLIFVVLAILLIPKTNSKYLLQSSTSLELKPDKYNLVVTKKVTRVHSVNDEIQFMISNNNKYPVKIDIIYNGNIIKTGITIPANTVNYNGKFKVPQNTYDQIVASHGANMHIKVTSPYSVQYSNQIRVETSKPYLVNRTIQTGFLGTTIDEQDIATIKFVDEGTIPPPGVLGSFDVSDGKKGNVIAWYTKNADDPTSYDVVISANGKINIKKTEFLFSNLMSLVEVDLTNTDISEASSFRATFFNTPSLKKIKWGGINTSSINTTFQMFAYTGLEELDLSSLDLSRVTNASSMFLDATELKTLKLDGVNTSSLTNMYSMFKNTKSLKNFNPGILNVSRVTNMNSAFMGTGSATSYDLSSWDVSKVVDFSSMFAEADDLKSINLSGWNVSSGEKFSNMFEKMGNIENLDLSSFTSSNANSLDKMFANSKKLKKIIFNNFTTSGVSTMESMCDGLINLTDLELDNFNANSNPNVSNMLKNCKKLEKLKLNNFEFTNSSNNSNLGLDNTNNKDTDITVKNSTEKSWLLSKYPALTNVHE